MVTFDAEAAHQSHTALLGNLRSHRDGLVEELNKVEREIVGVEKLVAFFAGAEERARELAQTKSDAPPEQEPAA
jgi:hypothetical protein